MRRDFDIISKIIKPNTKVLDIGCGTGELLNLLIEEKNIDGRGIEISQSGVSECVKKGLAVIQGDADTDLVYYPEKSFDYAIVSQTLQATKHPKDVVSEVVRIAKHAVFSVPNFGYWKSRFYLGFRGRMPVTKDLPYEWYNTPNIHFFTIKDFIVLCDELGYTIENSYYICNKKKYGKPNQNKLFANLFASKGIFVIRD